MINNQLPILRFPNYQDQWINKIIFNIAEKITDGTHDTPTQTKEGQPFLTAIHVKDGVIDYKNCYYLSIEEHNKIYKRCNPQKDDLLMVNIGAGTANCAIVDVDYEFSLKNVALIKPNKKLINAVFFSQIQRRNSKRLHHQISTGGAQPFMSLKQISNLKLIIPSDISEQQKIATFLTAVDEKINLLQKKKKGLEQYKKGVMQQLFSQKLRFKKEDGNDYPDWEEKKLGDFILKFIVPMRDKPKDLKGNIPWCRIEDFNGKYISKSKTNQGVTEDVVRDMNLKIYPINTLLVSCSANLGFCAITKKELITNQTFIGLVPNQDKINIDYLYHVMKLSSRRLNVLSSGTTISYLSRNEFENFKIHYPTITEQTKIANFIDTLDSKIELVNTQITNTQEFKKGLLQQMFV